MPDSIKTTRIAFVVAAGLEFATAALLLFVFIAGAVLIGWGTERAGLVGSALLGVTGVLLAIGFAAFGVLDLVIAAGIIRGRRWARVAVPVGTILGVVALIGLFGRDARDWFGAAVPVRRNPLVPPRAV
jgi:hypothetical protein